MKKTVFKLLSFLLCGLLILPFLPGFSFASNPDESAEALKSVISSYESKADGTVYTNMLPAYASYKNAVSVYNSYLSGGSDSGLASAASDLQNKIDNMAEFTPFSASGIYKINTSTVPHENSSDILFADGSADTKFVTSGKTYRKNEISIYYPDIVALYTGSEVVIPIIMGIKRYKAYDTIVNGVWLTSPDGLTLPDKWKTGSSGRDKFTWPETVDDRMYCNNFSEETSLSYKVPYSHVYSYRGYLHYTGTPADTVTKIPSTGWGVHDYSTAVNKDISFTYDTHSIKILNYKSLLDAISNNAQKLKVDISSYSAGGMEEVFEAFDSATSFDPNSYFTESNKVDECAADLESRVSVLNSCSPQKASADWTAFNLARSETASLLSASLSGTTKFTLAALSEAKTVLEDAASLYTLADSEKPACTQDQIDSAAQKLTALNKTFSAGVAESDVYDYCLSMSQLLNADETDPVKVKSAVSGIAVTSSVTINGETYTGYDYDRFVTAYETAYNENIKNYTVTLTNYSGDIYYLKSDGSLSSDESDAGKFNYGASVTVPSPGGLKGKWYLRFNTGNNDSQGSGSLSPVKGKALTSTSGTYCGRFAGEGSNQALKVTGNTNLYFLPDGEEANLKKVTYKYMFNSQKSNIAADTVYFDSDKAQAAYNELELNDPFYPGCDFEGYYLNGKKLDENSIVNLEKDTAILLNFISGKSDTFTITLQDSEGNTVENFTEIKPNQKITLSAPGAVEYVNSVSGVPLYYGSTYTFYATQSVSVKALKTSDSAAAVSLRAPVVKNGRIRLIADAAIPADCEILAAGIVLDRGGSIGSTVTLADLSQSGEVWNLASTHLINDNSGNSLPSFMISYNSAKSGISSTARAYIKYKNSSGREYYIYSDALNFTEN